MSETTHVNAAHSGTFQIGGDLSVNRLGFGAMRVTGEGIWGDPADREGALATLRRLPELGVNLIDTADSYGPAVSEELIREALHPYDSVVIATKAGLTRTGPDVWVPCGRPEYLIQQAHLSRRRLGVDRIDLWQLHRIDPQVPRDEQFGAVRDLMEQGVIRHAGLSEVGVEEIEAARRVFPVATVQNLYNLVHRKSEEVLEYCEREGIGFLPWYPLAAGSLAQPGGVLAEVAARTRAMPSQVALAWVLRRSPVMLPIPGTGKVKHLEENVAAAGVQLSDDDFRALDGVGRQEWERQQAARR
ncbi:aldo/keto reductase [Deinococcus budaensis]|uniref:Aryl-alcohol dehydrogenase-like predicted oxidoreductase n=1 Tax=Deinococcus budaensis TaxID=1665626 RepID=A0A7W8GGZ9_9DEIO|nr:aldo/keto reductase [Deinococcus budaensis]MBB5235154.1 aryl-alcohol dehydrogenase-like predicted oxidoreductase [Deinococcus budaensis]